MLNQVGLLGLTGFNAQLKSLSLHRWQWGPNVSLLAKRLTDVNIKPAWMDIQALQLLFSQYAAPVYFAPIYGCVATRPGDL
jgi:hypothetical protein